MQRMLGDFRSGMSMGPEDKRDPATQSEEHQESFVRWQAITIVQLGYVIGLLLTIAIAMLGFAFAQIKDATWSPTPCEKFVFSGGLVLLTFSIAFALACAINRLCDFRETTKIARDREKWLRKGYKEPEIDGLLNLRREHTENLGKCTWILFWCQAATFSLGALFLIIALTIIHHAELF
jgi:hypothetical protein